MKKIMLLAIPLLAFLILLPQTGHAMKVKRYQHAYWGSWDQTYDDCGTPSGTGYIKIKLKNIKRTGRISSAHVWFDNTGNYMEAKGRITKNADGTKHFRLKYQENGWAYDNYVITGTITKNKIVGEYDHSSTVYNDSCPWGGTVDLDTDPNN